MNNQIHQELIGKNFRRLYILAMIALLFSGFGQMPIFKRYYLADVPGLGWSADFYITLTIHYLAAALFLGLSVYYVIVKAVQKALWPLPSIRAYAYLVIFVTLVATGIILAARNLSGIVFPPGLVVAVSLLHIAGTMAFIVNAVLGLKFSKAKVKNGIRNQIREQSA